MKKICIALTLIMVMLTGCCAQAAEMPVFANFGEAVAAGGENHITGGTSEYMATIVEQGSQYYRVVTELDEHAKELDAAISEAEDISAAFDAYYAYVWTLPVSYTEAFIAEPLAQSDLDALVGKTIAELEAEGYVDTSSGTAGEEDLIAFWMAYGLYEYEMIVDADFETYEQKQESDELETLTVKSAKYNGVSSRATDLRIHMDGTVEPEEDLSEAFPAWMGKLFEAIQAAQNGEEVDFEAVFNALAEEEPEAAEQIRQFMELYQIPVPESQAQEAAEP